MKKTLLFLFAAAACITMPACTTVEARPEPTVQSTTTTTEERTLRSPSTGTTETRTIRAY